MVNLKSSMLDVMQRLDSCNCLLYHNLYVIELLYDQNRLKKCILTSKFQRQVYTIFILFFIDADKEILSSPWNIAKHSFPAPI